MISADTDIQYLKGVGEKRAEYLKSKGIDTVDALLHFYPRTYLDWTNITKISYSNFGDTVCIKAKIISAIKKTVIRNSMTIYNFIISDDSGEVMVALFNQNYLADKLKYGNEYIFYGKISGSEILKQLSSPKITEKENECIEPIYPSSEKLSAKVIEKIIKNALLITEINETLPREIIERNNLLDIKTALLNIHFPENQELFELAKNRLVFEELFILQIGLSFLKKSLRGINKAKIYNDNVIEFYENLEFEPTNAQKRVINECIKDIKSDKPMNRLVQGDVGSGKTLVAEALCFIMAKNGHQSALMAPTEILAEQHFKTFAGTMQKYGIKCGLLTGSTKAKQKNECKKMLLNGEIDIIIGTHALLSDDVKFDKLGLVITDEQHRFGVRQRGKLSEKGINPHTLVMSATPIPRTLGLIIYGDLDISVIDEYPKGRQQIQTYLVNSTFHQRIYRYIKKYIDEGRQAYIVCPLVDENELLDLTNVNEYYKKLSENEFSEYSVGLLHGKMSPKDKDLVMKKFSLGEIDLLVATTVIEVGIDVPNAVIMVIENAERFGLSQLHQLRGRIGRGKYKSSCILVSDSKSKMTSERLNVIKNNIDGFKIADEDLKQRGAGDFLGDRQHGLPNLKIADLFADTKVLKIANEEAKRVLIEDPYLIKQTNSKIKSQINTLYKNLNQN